MHKRFEKICANYIYEYFVKSDKIICIRGFSKAYMGPFISNINSLNNN